mmetsp:Transcript_165252/g.530393  ORF Transcript_165252/g.530393 Transcript_165252/m.530393 type:complete len:222 (-) Transcript_165252:46-711(-)
MARAAEPLDAYWDEGYESGVAPEEWYCDHETLKTALSWAFGPVDAAAQQAARPSTVPAVVATTAMALPLLLSVGCGRSALFSGWADARVAQVVAIDNSLPALRGRGVSAVEMLAADAFRLPFRDSTFDGAVDKGTIDWVVLSLIIAEDRNERLAALRAEFLRVLHPGGRLVVVTGLGGTDEDPLGFLTESTGEAAWDSVATCRLEGLAQNYRCHRLVRGSG